MDKKLLAILVCPTSRQPLDLLDAGRLARLNAAIAGGGVRFGEHVQAEPLREALVTRDGRRLYRIDDGIPVLLPEDGLEASAIAGLAA